MAATDFTTDEDINLDDFLNSPELAVPEQAPTARNIFNTPDDGVAAALAQPGAPEVKPTAPVVKTAEELAAEAQAVADLAGLDNFEEAEEEAKNPTGRPRSDKSALVSVVGKLIESGKLFDFDVEEGKEPKPLAEYSEKDLSELIELNLAQIQKDADERTPQEFFQSLPEQMQFAAKYLNDGGQDIKGLFRVLGEVEETKALDPSKPADQEKIVRQYLQAKQFGDADTIEDEIEDARTAGLLAKKAAKFKPELDGMQQEQVEAKLAAQEATKLRQKERRDTYLGGVLSTLKTGELAGQKIDNKLQQKLWNDLTQTTHQTMDGRATNKLGYNLERVQFGDKPDHGLLAEVNWLLDDPEGYRKHVGQTAAQKSTAETVRTIKTEQGRKSASGADTAADKSDDAPKRRTLTRPVNILTGKPQ